MMAAPKFGVSGRVILICVRTKIKEGLVREEIKLGLDGLALDMDTNSETCLIEAFFQCEALHFVGADDIVATYDPSEAVPGSSRKEKSFFV